MKVTSNRAWVRATGKQAPSQGSFRQVPPIGSIIHSAESPAPHHQRIACFRSAADLGHEDCSCYLRSSQLLYR
jgi:hypothetical protein